MTWAMIARADSGGLASQTWEIHRHLHPDRTLVVDMGDRGRGPAHPERFPGARVTNGYPSPQDWAWLLEDIDRLFTAESVYSHDHALPRLCAERGVELVIQANPELWDEAHRGPTTRVVLPTPWEAHRVKDATVLPMPVARDRLPFRLRDKAETFLFPHAPAFHDRNGLKIVLNALREVRSPCRVLIAGSSERMISRTRRHVTITWLGARDDYWTVYDQADVLLFPRRYGGLALPLQEALSSGMPVLTLDLAPYADLLPKECLIRPSSSVARPMKGGTFAVHDARPASLARKIDWLVNEPGTVKELSLASDAVAQGLSWERWLPAWQHTLG